MAWPVAFFLRSRVSWGPELSNGFLMDSKSLNHSGLV